MVKTANADMSAAQSEAPAAADIWLCRWEEKASSDCPDDS